MGSHRTGIFAVLFVMPLLFSCGGSGGGGGVTANDGIGNTMTVTIATQSPIGGGIGTTTILKELSMVTVITILIWRRIYIRTSGRTEIMLSSGVTGGPTPPVTLINIVTSDHTAGAYPITGDGTAGPTTYISYKDNAESHNSIISSGTVTIDSIGNVGEPVIGSFSAVVLCTSPSHTHAISGTFNMKRAN